MQSIEPASLCQRRDSQQIQKIDGSVIVPLCLEEGISQ